MLWLLKILPQWICCSCILFSIYSHYSKWLNAHYIHAVTAIVNSSKASWKNKDLVCLTKLMWLLHITVHSFICSIPGRNILICGDVSKEIKIKIKIIFFHSDFFLSQSSHPCWEANVFHSAFQVSSPYVARYHPETHWQWSNVSSKGHILFYNKKHQPIWETLFRASTYLRKKWSHDGSWWQIYRTISYVFSMICSDFLNGRSQRFLI